MKKKLFLRGWYRISTIVPATQIYSSVAKIPGAAPAVSQPIGSIETGVWCGDQETACNMAQLDSDFLDFQHES